jgi:hypothetical protein
MLHVKTEDKLFPLKNLVQYENKNLEEEVTSWLINLYNSPLSIHYEDKSLVPYNVLQ